MSATVVMASVLLATAPTSAHAAQAAQVGTCDTPLAESHLDINNVRARIFNNGALFYRRGSSQGGYEVPAGGNATFYRYRIFNRGSQPIDSSFVGVWQDADLGQAHNDYSGTDTTLGLAFTYNATNDDGSGFNQYGLSPPAVGLDYVRGPLVNGERIEMTTNLISFNDAGNFGDPQAAEDYWNYVHARWRYGPLTVGGHGYDGVGPPTDFSFPGDPVTGEFWSIVNSDGEGTRIHSNDMRVTTGSGPFVFAPGEEQEVVIAVVWARGVNHLDSVTELRDADRLAQSFSDSDFVTSVDAVDHPDLSARIGDRNAILEWTNAAASNNAAEGYSEYAPWLDATYEFEGYDVFQFDSPADSSGSRIATYDVTNGITRILDIGYGADSLGFVAATGRDSGITHEHAVGGLDNYQTYYFGVQAYAYQGVSTPKVIRSSMARVAVEPKPASGGSDAGVLDAIGIVPNPYRARSAYEVASEDRQVRFVNVPTESAVTIFTLSGSRIRDLVQNGDGVLRWDLRNEAGRQVASGAYLIRVRVPGIGAKALKFFLVRSNP